jgi:hypothetical protein
MMVVGDTGKILSGFRVEGPRLIPERRMNGAPNAPARPQRESNALSAGLRQWVEACRGGAQSAGSFLHAAGISEAVNLYAVALRTRKRLLFDAAAQKITNVPAANQYLSRDYRKGWSPESV